MLFRWLVLLGVAYLVWRLVQSLKHSAPGRRKIEPTDKTPWDVLGIKRGATASEIKAAYQRKVAEYHPDKVASMGEKIQQVAKQEMQRINAAYEALKSKP